MLLYSMPLAETTAALRSGRFDLHDHIDAVCDRVELADEQVHSFLPETDRRARLHQAADGLLAQYPNVETRPMLFGALVGVKDIFHVDGFVTQAGSALPAEHFAGEEAAAVQLLRKAGALILGKTVTTEFAYFEPGPTRNPHNLGHTPGGSSSGSAAAVAAGLSDLALGTQTIGSVIRPAAFCGIVGYKPTLDRIPSQGLVYFSRTIDHVGLFTQDVPGMRLAAALLCHNWGEVLMTDADLPILGVPDGPYLRQADPSALSGFSMQLAKLRQVGYTVWHVPTLVDIEELNVLHRRLVFGEFAREHRELYGRYKQLYRPRTAEIIELGLQVGEGELDELRGSCIYFRDQIETQMEQAGIDLWVSPAAIGPAPAGIHATGDPNMNLPWTMAGLPTLTVPAGEIDGLPLGLQLTAQFDEDEVLLAWGEMILDDLNQE